MTIAEATKKYVDEALRAVTEHMEKSYWSDHAAPSVTAVSPAPGMEIPVAVVVCACGEPWRPGSHTKACCTEAVPVCLMCKAPALAPCTCPVSYAGLVHVEGCPTISATVNRKRKADACRLPPPPLGPLYEVSRDGKTWERRSMGESFGDVRFMRKDGVLEAVRNCRNVITRSGEHGFDFQRRLVELEAEDDAPIVTGPEYREPPLSAYFERGAGIKALTLPEARPRFVSSVGDHDLLADP